jgi:molecular chaperone Hsp33
MRDELLVFEGARGARLAVCRAERLSREAALRHGLAPGSAAALAQALAGTLLLADSDPDQARVDLHLRCTGPVQGMLTDADARGAVRGLVRVTDLSREGKALAERAAEPSAPARSVQPVEPTVSQSTIDDPGPAEATRFDPRPLLATRHDEVAGSLSILRATEGPGDLHRTAFPFAGADLGAALTLYLRNDRPGGGEMALEVAFRSREPLAAVAGVLLSSDAEGDDDLSALGKPLRQRILRDSLRPEEDAKALAERIAGALDLGPLRLRTEVRPRFSCRCSRPRVERALRILGALELRDMADRDGGAEARCDFCATTYRLTRDQLLDLARAV